MTCRTNSFSRHTFKIHFAFLAAVLTLGAIGLYAQTPPKPVDPFQKISFKPDAKCTVPATGEVTALVKNGVELSVSEDYDCDGVSDAYDNCVGMPNRDQADANGNAIGDLCEAAATIKTTPPAKPSPTKTKPTKPRKPEPRDKRRSNAKPNTRKSKESDKRSNPSTKKRRIH